MIPVCTKSFIREIPKNFRTTGALFPSSRALAEELTKDLREIGRKPLTILEVGGGTGAVTKVITSQMIEGDRLDVVEINPLFVKILNESISKPEQARHSWKRIEIIESDIRKLTASHSYDIIICALPFNNFDPLTTKSIFDAMCELLKPGGLLSYFEYWGVRALKWTLIGTDIRKHSIETGRHTEELHRRMAGSRHFIFANLPPAIIHRMKKPI